MPEKPITQIKQETTPPPGYQFDEKGTQVRFDEHGKWRVLDIEEGHIIALNSLVIQQRAFQRIRTMSNRFPSPIAQ